MFELPSQWGFSQSFSPQPDLSIDHRGPTRGPCAFSARTDSEFTESDTVLVSQVAGAKCSLESGLPKPFLSSSLFGPSPSRDAPWDLHPSSTSTWTLWASMFHSSPAFNDGKIPCLRRQNNTSVRAGVHGAGSSAWAVADASYEGCRSIACNWFLF